MVRYECDYCHTIKEPEDVWILGFAAENIGVTSARREITISSSWDEERAVDYLAVHFCSDSCRQNYVAELFGDQLPAETMEVQSPASQKTIVRVFPKAKTEARVARRKTAPKSRARKRAS